MNRLDKETSPYLAQHAANPVDWYPWGNEALAAARLLDRPLFISIGYSACHWCHVMAHESFEDETVAAQLNANFVSVKVDREERPDVDAVYIEAAQALTGGAGWPLSIFALSDGRPFFTGTYFPPLPRPGSPSFSEVLSAVKGAWDERRGELEDQAERLTEVVTSRLSAPQAGPAVDPAALVGEAVGRYRSMYDERHGGTGSAPKFPQPPMLELLLYAHATGDEVALEMARTTLFAMASGGLYDQLGGGFCRYSVDRAWLVPHFEKMAYDQALLSRAYLHAYELTLDERLLGIAEETLSYLCRDLSSDEGGFYSSEDADSEGQEGRFYTFTPEEITAVLGPERAERALLSFGIGTVANFEGGRFVLSRPSGVPPRGKHDEDREALLLARAGRVRPGRDEKVLTEWSAMAASVLAESALFLSRDDLGARALGAGEFIFSRLRRDDGRYLRSYKDGRAAHLGGLADYAWVVELYCRLYELFAEATWLGRAREAADQMLLLFAAPDGGFFMTGSDAEVLVARPRDRYDGVVPAGDSVAYSSLLRLSSLSGDARYEAAAQAVLLSSAAACEMAPLAFSHLLVAAATRQRGTIEVVVPGEGREKLRRIEGRYLPGAVVAWGDPSASPLFEGRVEGEAYLCRGGVCALPVRDDEGFSRLLDELVLF